MSTLPKLGCATSQDNAGYAVTMARAVNVSRMGWRPSRSETAPITGNQNKFETPSAQHDRAQRPHQEAGAERHEGEEERRDLVVAREKGMGDVRGVEAKQEKIEHLKEIAAGDAHHRGQPRRSGVSVHGLYLVSRSGMRHHYHRMIVPGNAHSIASSARPTSGSGTVSPSILAVLRLMISSNLVDCWTGRSAGFSPLRIRPV